MNNPYSNENNPIISNNYYLQNSIDNNFKEKKVIFTIDSYPNINTKENNEIIDVEYEEINKENKTCLP